MAQRPAWIVEQGDDVGFTLIEMIVVIIIFSVLAALALPRFFESVEFTRSMEALRTFSALKISLNTCYSHTLDYANCTDLGNLDMGDLTSTPGTHFSYSVTAADQQSFTIVALRNSVNGGDNTSTITYMYDDISGITKSGTGVFHGLK